MVTSLASYGASEMINLYAEYIKEREGLSLLTTESSFLSYKIDKEIALLSDLFVSKEKRKSFECFGIVSCFFDICKEQGAKLVVCQVDRMANSYQDSLATIKRYYFSQFSDDGRFIFLKKEVDEWFNDFEKFGHIGHTIKELIKKKIKEV
jgi:hypothetical protein